VLISINCTKRSNSYSKVSTILPMPSNVTSKRVLQPFKVTPVKD